MINKDIIRIGFILTEWKIALGGSRTQDLRLKFLPIEITRQRSDLQN